MATTARYLNTINRRARFFLAEVVRFTDEVPEGEEVFEARTMLKPDPTRAGSRNQRGVRLTRESLLEPIEVPGYADAIGDLLDTAEATAPIVSWGTGGVSSLHTGLDSYATRLAELGRDPIANGGLAAIHFSPSSACAHISEIIQALDVLTGAVQA